MGVIDYVGYKFTVLGGLLKVSKRILVVMKAKRIGNIYKIEGSVEINHGVVFSEGASGSTCLWRQHLGHMREKGINIHVHRKLLPRLQYLNFNLCKHHVFRKKSR